MSRIVRSVVKSSVFSRRQEIKRLPLPGRVGVQSCKGASVLMMDIKLFLSLSGSPRQPPA